MLRSSAEQVRYETNTVEGASVPVTRLCVEYKVFLLRAVLLSEVMHRSNGWRAGVSAVPVTVGGWCTIGKDIRYTIDGSRLNSRENAFMRCYFCYLQTSCTTWNY